MSNEPDESSEVDEAQVQTSGWVDRRAAMTNRDFPVPGPFDEPLRIAFTREAHAEIVAHAKESLDRELCGVLLGTVCQDNDGVWVFAEVALRGETDRQGGTHVTYTHKTWEKIYAVKDAEYPKMSILGWYHTHPGFGVQFSEMDLFIQRNFFAGDTQFALVIDPQSGEEAIVANTVKGTKYVSRFWVNGKEQRGQVPREESSSDSQNALSSTGIPGEWDDRLCRVEERLSQVLQATESQRESQGRLFLLFGFLVALLITGYIAYSVLENVLNRAMPPKELQIVKVPVRINDKVMMVGMQVVGWEIPDGENLLKDAEAAAEQRALARALQIMQHPDSQQAMESMDAANTNSMLSPTFTFYWAILATMLSLALLVFGFIR